MRVRVATALVCMTLLPAARAQPPDSTTNSPLQIGNGGPIILVHRPQKTLYLPGPWFKQGLNEVIVFDVDSALSRTIEGLTAPNLGQETSNTKQ